MVRVSLHLRRFTSGYVSIDFLVDTGATNSYLHPQDAMIKIGIDPAMLKDPTQWSSQQPTNGFSGSVSCYVEPATYLFHDDNNKPARRIVHEIHIAPPTSTNDTLPSILGYGYPESGSAWTTWG